MTGDGLDELLETIWRGIVAARETVAEAEPEATEEAIDLITPARLRRDA